MEENKQLEEILMSIYDVRPSTARMIKHIVKSVCIIAESEYKRGEMKKECYELREEPKTEPIIVVHGQRCENCTYHYPAEPYCSRMGIPVEDDFFCRDWTKGEEE